MKRLVTTFCITAFALIAGTAQAQDTPVQNLSVAEFRQTLVDFGTYLDAHKGTNVTQQFSALTDEQLQMVLPSLTDTRKFQSAVATLKQTDAVSPILSKMQSSRIATRGIASVVQNASVYPSCNADTIIDTSANAVCTPAYPDPNNSAWQFMVGALNGIGAFSPTDYASVSSQQCGLTVETSLQQASAFLQGTVLAASAVCGALQAIPLTGTIASGVCWAANAVFSIGAAVSTGLYSDCSEQDGNVNSAEIDAAFHNTVTIYDKLGAVNNQITNEFNAASTQLTNVDTDIDTKISNLDNHVSAEFTALDAHITTLIGNLATQLTNSTAFLNADLRQVMKLQLTPDGLKVINPLILTCNGTNCPNVLAKCPAAGCSWNNAGPLP